MKYPMTMLVASLCVAVSACDIPDTTMMNGDVTLKGDVVTLHVKDDPDAQVSSAGDLKVGDKTIVTTPAQRGLLVLYYQGIADVHDTGVAMGKAGIGMGKKAVEDKLSGKTKADTDKDAENGGDEMKVLAQKICQDQVNMKTVQNQLAAQLSDFKPYSHIFTDDNTSDCKKDSDD